MIASIKTQIRITFKKRDFRFALFLLFVYAGYVFIAAVVKNWGSEVSTMLDANEYICYSPSNSDYSIFHFLFPFLIVIPSATSYIDDYKNQLLSVYVTRSSRVCYYISKLVSCFVGTALAVAIPFFCNLILTNLFFPHNHNTLLGGYQGGNFYRNLLGLNTMYFTEYPKVPFLTVFLKSPFLYHLLYLVILSSFAGLMAAFVLSLSFVWRKRKLFLFIPVYVIIQVLTNMDSVFLDRAGDYGFSFWDFETRKHILPENLEWKDLYKYVDINIMDYVFPEFYGALSPYFFVGFLLIVAVIITGVTVYGVRQRLKSIQ